MRAAVTRKSYSTKAMTGFLRKRGRVATISTNTHLVCCRAAEVIKSQSGRPLHLKPLSVKGHVAQGLKPTGLYDRHTVLPVARQVGQSHSAVAADIQFLAPQRCQAHEAGQRPGLDDVNLGGVARVRSALPGSARSTRVLFSYAVRFAGTKAGLSSCQEGQIAGVEKLYMNLRVQYHRETELKIIKPD